MNNNPLFSVIIPTYNRAFLLKRALESLLAQTYKSFEVLVCDDGSTDNTAEVVALFKGKLNITYLSEENWGGPARPRNNGIKAAKGEWICFLDSDDIWYPDKLEYILNYVNDFDLIYHGLDIIKPNGIDKYSLKTRDIRKPVFNNLLIYKNAVRTSGACVRKSVIYEVNGLSEEKNLMTAAEDYDLWLRISRVTERFKAIKKNLGGYYIENDNLTKNFEKQQAGLLHIYATYTHLLPLKEQKKAHATLMYGMAKFDFESNNFKDSVKNFLKTLKHGVFQIKVKSLFYLMFVAFSAIGNIRKKE